MSDPTPAELGLLQQRLTLAAQYLLSLTGRDNGEIKIGNGFRARVILSDVDATLFVGSHHLSEPTQHPRLWAYAADAAEKAVDAATAARETELSNVEAKLGLGAEPTKES